MIVSQTNKHTHGFHHNSMMVYDFQMQQFIPCHVEFIMHSSVVHHVTKGFGANQTPDLTCKITIKTDIIPDAKWILDWSKSIYGSNYTTLPKDYKRELFICSAIEYSNGFMLYGSIISGFTMNEDTIESEIRCDHYESNVDGLMQIKPLRRDYMLNKILGIE